MSALRSYNKLIQYINNNPLPAFNDEPNDAIAQQEINYIPNTGIPVDVLDLHRQEVMDI